MDSVSASSTPPNPISRTSSGAISNAPASSQQSQSQNAKGSSNLLAPIPTPSTEQLKVADQLRKTVFASLNNADLMETTIVTNFEEIKSLFPIWQDYPPESIAKLPSGHPDKVMYTKSLFCIAVFYYKQANYPILLSRLQGRGIGKQSASVEPPKPKKPEGVIRWQQELSKAHNMVVFSFSFYFS